MPLYRQQDALAQLGWSPSRSTLCQIVATAGDLIVPLVEQLRLRVLASGVIASDDTPVTLLTPGVGKGSGRKNWMFIGSQDAGQRTAAILSVISSAHRHDLDEWAYLYDVLQQLARGTADLNSLLPDVWKAAHPEQVRTFRVDEKQQRAERRRYLRVRRRLEQRAAA